MSSNKNLHIPHLEDLIFLEGSKGISHITDILDELCQTIYQGKKETLISTKWDGAPAFVFGKHPENGKFFIGTKSVFNKETPKIYYSLMDIKMLCEDRKLANKLFSIYLFLYQEKIERVYQGDLIWNEDSACDLGTGISSKVNTLTYKFEGINQLEYHLGIVIHTEYIGEKLSEMRANLDFVWPEIFDNIRYLKIINPRLSLKPAYIKDSDLDIFRMVNEISEMGDRLNGSDLTLLNFLLDVPSWQEKFLRYINYCVKHTFVPLSIDFIDWVASETEKKCISLKTSKSQEYHRRDFQELKNVVTSSLLFDNLFSFYRAIGDVKVKILEKLETYQDPNIEVFFENQKTVHEGYVISGPFRTVKLVDRYTFSKRNFESVKPWN